MSSRLCFLTPRLIAGLSISQPACCSDSPGLSIHGEAKQGYTDTAPKTPRIVAEKRRPTGRGFFTAYETALLLPWRFAALRTPKKLYHKKFLCINNYSCTGIYDMFVGKMLGGSFVAVPCFQAIGLNPIATLSFHVRSPAPLRPPGTLAKSLGSDHVGSKTRCADARLI